MGICGEQSCEVKEIHPLASVLKELRTGSVYSEGCADDLSLGAEESAKEQQRKSQRRHKNLKLYLVETPWKLFSSPTSYSTIKCIDNTHAI